MSVSAFSGFRKTPFSRLPIIQSLKGASAAGFWCCTADKISSHAPNTMAELPTPPSLLDEVNPRLVVAVTRSQKRKREVERALVTVSSLFGAHLPPACVSVRQPSSRSRVRMRRRYGRQRQRAAYGILAGCFFPSIRRPCSPKLERSFSASSLKTRFSPCSLFCRSARRPARRLKLWKLPRGLLLRKALVAR